MSTGLTTFVRSWPPLFVVDSCFLFYGFATHHYSSTYLRMVCFGPRVFSSAQGRASLVRLLPKEQVFLTNEETRRREASEASEGGPSLDDRLQVWRNEIMMKLHAVSFCVES